MKIKPEHLAVMRERITAVYPQLKPLEHYAALPNVKDPAMRRRWDASHLAQLSPFFALEVYSYANDEHINTALRAILAELDTKP